MIHEKIFLYEGREDVYLRTFVREPDEELYFGEPFPAVLICPGGGYLNCSEREAEPVAMRFAAMGYHAFVLDYSVYGNGAHLANIAAVRGARKETMHPQPHLDIGNALKLIARHKEEWKVDIDRVSLMGFSAGAHNCAMYAVNYERFGGIKPLTCVLGYGLFDYTLMPFPKSGEKDGEKLGPREIMNIAYFGESNPSAERLLEVSPARHVKADTPPMFIWATFGDSLLVCRQSLGLADALSQAGVPFEIHIFEDGPHGLALADQASAAARYETDVDAANWVRLAESWLKKRMALKLLDKPKWMTRAEEDPSS